MLLGIRCASLVAIIATIGLFSTNHTFYIHSPAPRFLPRSINVLTATTDDLLALLQNGTVTSVQLVTEYQWRITRDDKAGHWLNAILSSAPTEALRIAKTRDEQRAQGKLLGPLHGVPYVVKDTMVTDRSLGMGTTYGSYALQYSIAPKMAFVVDKAQEAGAILIGKTNPQELGGYKGYTNAGWSKVGGQTISPYDLGNPCGSSSGSGVAVSAGFSPVALGTDTTGSVTCPAIFNGAYGFRPSVGLLSRSGILPTTTSFDTPGVIAKSVADIALWINVLSQADERDPATQAAPIRRFKDYRRQLDGKWKDWRIGVLDRAVFWNESMPIMTTVVEDTQMMKSLNASLKHFENLGVTILEAVRLPMAHLPDLHPTLYHKLLDYELKTNLDAYFATLKNTTIHSVEDLVNFNKENPELAWDDGHEGQEFLERALNSKLSHHEYIELQKQRATLVQTGGIEYVLDTYDLDALVVPAFTELSGVIAMCGTPFGVLPVGKYPFGRPFGLGFTVRRFDDELLLHIMAAAEASLPPRPVPKTFKYGSCGDKVRYWWERVKRTYGPIPKVV